MRLAAIISILMLTITIQYSVDIIPFRAFISGFLSTIKGEKIKIQLPENCLGKNQEEEIRQFLENIQSEQPLIALAMSQKFLTDFEANCPVKEFEEILIDVKALLSNENPNVFEKIQFQSKSLLSLFEDFEMEIQKIPTTNEEAETFGKYLGKAFNIIMYDNVHNFLKFLDTEAQTKNDSDQLSDSSKTISPKPMELFVDGFFEGVSSVPFEQNKCHLDVFDVKSQIVEAFQNFINAIRKEAGVIDAMRKIYELLTKLKGLDANCHFEALSFDLISLGTKIGLAKFIYRLSTHFPSIMLDVHTFYSDFRVREFRGCGEAFGLLIKTALNYSTI